jgi:hypothetical protein
MIWCIRQIKVNKIISQIRKLKHNSSYMSSMLKVHQRDQKYSEQFNENLSLMLHILHATILHTQNLTPTCSTTFFIC